MGDQGSSGNDGGGDGGGGNTTPTTINIDPGTLAAILGGSGGSSSSSSGGGHTAPVDPTVSAAEQFYFQLWGVKPPTEYISGFIKGGHDLFDFITWQLSRPGAAKTKYFRDRFSSYAGELAQVMGTR